MNKPEIEIDRFGRINLRGSVRIDWRCDIYNNEDGIQIDLEHVRASDGIRVHYESDRDGWVIEQPTKLSWKAGDPDEGNPHWKEAAFVPSWNFTEEEMLKLEG